MTMEEFKANSSVHVAFREAMSMRLLDLERALGFPEMVPVPWHDYQIEANREATANHPNLKQAVVDIGGVWEVYLFETWRETMAEFFGSDWRRNQVPLPAASSESSVADRSSQGPG